MRLRIFYSYRRYFIWAIAALFALLQLFVGINNDNKILLFCAIGILTNGDVYHYWLEINPPLIMIIYCIPAAMILWLKIPAAFAFQGYTVLLSLWGVRRIQRVLANTSLEIILQRRLVDSAIFILFVLPACVQCFGDREHLFFIFSLPWMIQMLWGITPAARSVIPAVIGFCLKPYNLLIAGALILFGGNSKLSLRERIFSPNTYIIASGVIFYLLITIIAFPEYIFQVIPLLLVVYPYIQISFVQKTAFFGIISTLSLTILSFFHSNIRNISTWCAFIITSGLCYLLNGGWVYTLYLLLAPLFLTCVQVIQVRDETKGWFFWLPLTIISAILLYCSLASILQDILSTSKTGYATNYFNPPNALITELRQNDDKEFILLSDSLWGVNISGLGIPPTHVYAFDFLWPFPWAYAHQTDTRSIWVMDTMANYLVKALNRQPSPVLLIDGSPSMRRMPYRKNKSRIDLLAVLARGHPAVREALKHYRLVKTIDICNARQLGYCRFEVMRPFAY